MCFRRGTVTGDKRIRSLMFTCRQWHARWNSVKHSIYCSSKCVFDTLPETSAGRLKLGGTLSEWIDVAIILYTSNIGSRNDELKWASLYVLDVV